MACTLYIVDKLNLAAISNVANLRKEADQQKNIVDDYLK